MSLVNPYCTVQQVHDELRNSDASLDMQITDCINQASRFIDDYKGRDYFQHDFSINPLLFDKSDTAFVIRDTLFFKYRPLISLASVTVAGTVWTADTNYILKEDRLIAVCGCFEQWLCRLTDRISIVGIFGYAQATAADVPTGLPAHINKAAILAAAALSGHNQKESVGLDGSKQAFIDKNIPKTVFDLLGRRRTFM